MASPDRSRLSVWLRLGCCLLLAAAPHSGRALSFLPFEGVRAQYELFSHEGTDHTVGYLRPTSLRAGAPAIVVLHFNLGEAPSMANLTEIGELARDEGALLILPHAPGLQWAHDPAENGRDDVGYLAALIDHAVERFGLDARRIYMTGYSQGGNMTVRMACERPDKIAAGAPVAATMRRTLAAQCAPSVPTPMVFFHGTRDDQVPYDGLQRPALPILPPQPGVAMSAPDALQFWATVNGCNGAPVRTRLPTPVTDGTGLLLDRHEQCPPGGAAMLYTVEEGGHNWPGALDVIPRIGLTSQNLSANRALWTFFREFSR